MQITREIFELLQEPHITQFPEYRIGDIVNVVEECKPVRGTSTGMFWDKAGAQGKECLIIDKTFSEEENTYLYDLVLDNNEGHTSSYISSDFKESWDIMEKTRYPMGLPPVMKPKEETPSKVDVLDINDVQLNAVLKILSGTKLTQEDLASLGI